jgi:hypothetical protein
MGNSAAYLKEVFQRTEHSTSELESAKCAPVQKLIDPRSPTDQFSRTPIEVRYSLTFFHFVSNADE